MTDVGAVIEAVLFVAEEPVPTEELAEVLEISRDEVAGTLDRLAAELEPGRSRRRVARGRRRVASLHGS